MSTMTNVPDAMLRSELVSRRNRLEALAGTGTRLSLEALIAEVDAALARLDAGTYGLCDVCHEPIEADRLAADPLVRVCLDHLTPGQRTQLERDLELAGRIQAALLPPEQIVLPGWDVHYEYLPAGVVSGDYCDVIRGAGGSTAVVIGDVSGKGVAASLLMSNLHALFRSLVAAAVPFAELVPRVNSIFCASTLPSSFATLVCAALERTGRAEICNAGHCPPLVVTEGRVRAIEPTGTAVGIFCDGQFAVTPVQLGEGDLLVLYTDGLSEAFNDAGEEFGVARLERILAARWNAPAREVARACLVEARSFRGGHPAHDDLTLLVIRRTGREGLPA